MSTIEVKVVRPFKVEHHPNADRLDIVTFGGEGGFRCVTGRDEFTTDSLVVYFPPDSILTTKIMDLLANNKVKMSSNRLRTIKIRGTISEGLCLDPKLLNVPDKLISEGNDLTKYLGIKKCEPSKSKRSYLKAAPKSNVFSIKNDTKDNNHYFPRYTEIEHFQKHPQSIHLGEEVSITVKIHGTNFRAGYVVKKHPSLKDKINALWNKIRNIFSKEKIEEEAMEFLVGTHRTIRSSNPTLLQKILSFFDKRQRRIDKYISKEFKQDVYLRAAEKYLLKPILKHMSNHIGKFYYKGQTKPSVIIYGEVYGPGIQKRYDYGVEEGDIKLKIFDIRVNGKYINVKDARLLCLLYNLPYVEEIYSGPFFLHHLALAEQIDVIKGKKYTREGIVIKPLIDRYDRYGRVIYKKLNPRYLLNKTNSENH